MVGIVLLMLSWITLAPGLVFLILIVFSVTRLGYLGLFVVRTNIRQITENVGVFLQVCVVPV